jgi:hypothetical protein
MLSSLGQACDDGDRTLTAPFIHRCMHFCSDMARFGKVCKLVGFKPFQTAADALEQINAVSESVLTDELKNFLTTNLPKVSG